MCNSTSIPMQFCHKATLGHLSMMNSDNVGKNSSYSTKQIIGNATAYFDTIYCTGDVVWCGNELVWKFLKARLDSTKETIGNC